jgi:hypothetical protein
LRQGLGISVILGRRSGSMGLISGIEVCAPLIVGAVGFHQWHNI